MYFDSTFEIIVRSRVGQDEEETKSMVYKSTYSFIADGTKQIMLDIEYNPTLTREQKDIAYLKLTALFPDYAYANIFWFVIIVPDNS